MNTIRFHLKRYMLIKRMIPLIIETEGINEKEAIKDFYKILA